MKILAEMGFRKTFENEELIEMVNEENIVIHFNKKSHEYEVNKFLFDTIDETSITTVMVSVLLGKLPSYYIKANE